ncbi:uncharacterized protein TNCV_3785681 [Trichonephila clavipes]|nr:uncharacterized protein TNCV_3785681 [Trichonephila clavipes]
MNLGAIFGDFRDQLERMQDAGVVFINLHTISNTRNIFLGPVLAKSPGLSIQCRSSRAHQTALARLRSGHLRSMTFVQGVKSFFTCPWYLLVSHEIQKMHLLDCWGSCMKSKAWCDNTVPMHTCIPKYCGVLLSDITRQPMTVRKPNSWTPVSRSDDEAHFWLNGYVNKQNCRIWSEANPQVYVETPLHPEKLTVWCALWAGGILLQKR